MDLLSATQPRLRAPERAARGDVVEVRTLVSHPMESGFRRDTAGVLVQRDILTHLVGLYDGHEVFRAELHPAVAANPYLSFHLRLQTSGTLTVRWEAHGRAMAEISQAIEVSG